MDLGRLIDAAKQLFEGKLDAGSLTEGTALDGLAERANLEGLAADAGELQDIAGGEGGVGEKAQAALDALREGGPSVRG